MQVIAVAAGVAFLAGAGVDVYAAIERAGKLPLISLALKAMVLLAFLVWWLLLVSGVYRDWQDLTTFATVVVVSLGITAVTTVLDIIVAAGIWKRHRD